MSMEEYERIYRETERAIRRMKPDRARRDRVWNKVFDMKVKEAGR